MAEQQQKLERIRNLLEAIEGRIKECRQIVRGEGKIYRQKLKRK